MWKHVLVGNDDGVRAGAMLEEAQRRRAVGAVVGAAAGDALGAPYEFLAPIAESDDVEMVGGGILGWDAGEWTDDTAMAIVVLEAAAAQPDRDLRISTPQDQIAREWYAWSLGTPDIGALTSTVLRRALELARADERIAPRAQDLRSAAESAHEELPMVAGNGSLMRTYAAVLPFLRAGDDAAAEGIEAICRLTHVHPDATDACLLWGFAIRRAILTGEIDARAGLERLDPERARRWLQRIEEAESVSPAAFRRNGWVVGAFQAAWSAVHAQLPIPEGKFAQRASFARAVESAVRAGYDTDTVACITGALMGAALGPKAVPTEWRRALFGWPGYGTRELIALAQRAIGPDGAPTADGGDSA